MWIVNIALRRPYTFIVAALLILLASPFVLRKAPIDVFPEIDIPVVGILLSYNGLTAAEMANRITTPMERNLANAVSDMEHVESQSMAGLAVIKVFFQPNTDMATAISQLVASTQSSLRSLPPGATPPTIVKYSASNLPILQLGLSSPSLSDQELNDQVFNGLRPKIVTIPGVAVTFPYGGKSRQVSVDLDGPALTARGLTPVDVVNALSLQNLTLPTGTAKIGASELNVAMNGSPATLAALGDIPIRTVNGSTVYIRDVANVRDGYQPQTNIVRRDGERGLLMTVLKNGGASTLDILKTVAEVLPKAALTMPPDIKITPLADQSVFVQSAITGVVHEAIIAATLTAALILLFLGNWRSTAIIAISIPLSILSSIIAMHLIGQTINIMTLGGLALAVGILVDDATVTIENIERHLHMGKNPHQAILDGAAEIAVPALVSTLCICIVFVPMFLLTGVARHLFVPLAEAVVFAMLASYVLSRTLVPTLAMYLMRQQARSGTAKGEPGRLRRIHLAFDQGFERFRAQYTLVLAALLNRKKSFASGFLLFCLASGGLFALIGQDFFPAVDAGQLRLHVRAPVGTRLEEMPQLADQIQAAIRKVIPKDELANIVDIVGGPYTPYNTIYNNNGTFDSSDTEIMISLNKGHEPSANYIRALRAELPRQFPGVEFYFQSADMVSQTLNFGLPAHIDIQFSGNNVDQNLVLASELLNDIRKVSGAVDSYIYQRFNKHTISLEMDRSRLLQTSLVARDVAQNALISLSSSFQTAPTYWLNPTNGNVYNVAVQMRQSDIDSMSALLSIPINSSPTGNQVKEPQLLGDVVQVKASSQQGIVSHFNNSNVIDVYAAVDGRDLGGTFADIEPLIEKVRAKLPRGSDITVRGQVQTMRDSFTGLGLGLAVAIVLVYLLIVVNFQSWLDALIIITALPAALAGILWMLFLTGTSLSVPALTGAIMTVGVATANSILVVSFARQRLSEGVPATMAALEAGGTRLRPVLMTALAMIIGMVPMAIGVGEGGEQNAPLGRAVIGGLMLATVSTLIFVPLVFAGLHRRHLAPVSKASLLSNDLQAA
ncbi:efflux RND transporter permease subunit [Aquabacterium sp. CECT 9606]|uniref:efflux RND transporter permease subunit n=1 Tax=Aquabacterium sp. CECT 9606 TaxID=2845822 RepID=UPI001E632545|nr:efflux RND transporter permease subunit [Aquabacterium sp. CECT 9606]CAH0352933.1 Cobalt-zinc-cadmium resistance protein CzcA [Aquabacterium sp. CECT 9606]